MEVYEALGMSHFDVMQSMAMNLETALTMMQFWITATFAIIVAFHFAGQQLTRMMTILVLALYVAVSAVSIMAYIQSGFSMVYWAEAGEIYAVQKQVMTQAQFDVAVFWRDIALIGGGLLIVLGTIATVYFGLHVRRRPVTLNV